MIRGRDTEEGKHIIHYLTNYCYYTGGESERRRCTVLLEAAHRLSSATKRHCHGAQKPSPALSPCSWSCKAEQRSRRQMVGRWGLKMVTLHWPRLGRMELNEWHAATNSPWAARITESLRLAKTSEVPKANPLPTPTVPTAHPSVPHPHSTAKPPGTVTMGIAARRWCH